MSPEGLQVGEWSIPDSELEELFSTAGGPGGQHANRSETAVTVRLDVASSSLPDEVRAKLAERLSPIVEAVAADSRSQWRNRALARQRLAEKLEEALKDPAPRTATKPPRSARRRRLAEKRARGRLKKERRPPGVDEP